MGNPNPKRWDWRNWICTGVASAFALSVLTPSAGCKSEPDGAAGAGGGVNVPISGAGPTGAGAGTVTGCPGVVADPGETVLVGGGDFVMGCDATMDPECQADEMPPHTVTLTEFHIDKTEVTQAQYQQCVDAGRCAMPATDDRCVWDCNTPSLPAQCIDYQSAANYCNFAGKRLPTEAEWEKAARGTDSRKFPWGNDPADCSRANMSGCAGNVTPVGNYPAGASPYGALDMAGNVVEMVSDWYDPGYYAVSPAADPVGPATGTQFGGRGGGYKSEATFIRAAKRDKYDVPDNGPAFGFRCVQ